MWKYYVDAMVNLNRETANQTNQGNQGTQKRAALALAFQEADESNNMSEEHYQKYIELLFANETKSEVIPKVTSINSTPLP